MPLPSDFEILTSVTALTRLLASAKFRWETATRSPGRRGIKTTQMPREKSLHFAWSVAEARRLVPHRGATPLALSGPNAGGGTRRREAAS